MNRLKPAPSLLYLECSCGTVGMDYRLFEAVSAIMHGVTKFMVSIIATVLLCVMAVIMFALVSASTAEAASTGVRPSLDTRASAGPPLSRNAAVDQAGSYADCCYNTPNRRGRGLGYWIIEGIWFVVRWFALLVWGFWPYVLTLIGGIVVLFIAIPLVRKWRARQCIGPPQNGYQTQAGAGTAHEMRFSLPNDGDRDDMRLPEESVRETERLEPPIHHQRDDVERERQLQEFRRQQEERQRDWERRREQLRTEQAARVQSVSEEPGINAMEPPSGDDVVPVSAEPTQPAAAISSVTTRHQARRYLLAPLIVSFLTLTLVVGIGLLVAYVVLSASSGTPVTAAVEPTRDLEATITAAVAAAMKPAPLTSSSAAVSEAGNASIATPIATLPESEQPSPHPPVADAVPPTLPSDLLPTVECPGCAVPDPPADGYVEWVREPKVSESGVLAFRARIDEQAGFVVAGASCGLANATLTDAHAFYGAIIPHSMANACGGLPGDRIADQYTYFGNLLTVRLQMDPVAARHPHLTLCLWKGGVTEDLLDCVPVKQP